MQGRPIDKREIVRDILADRVKDQAVAELASFILEDRKYNRTLDQIVLHLQSGLPVPIPDGGEQFVIRERQRRFDSQVAQEMQNVLMNDFSSQFGAGVPRPWGFSTEPLSSQASNPFIPTNFYPQGQFSNLASVPCIPVPTTTNCYPQSQFSNFSSVPFPTNAVMIPHP